MTKESKKEQSIELLNLLQEVKYEIETNTKSKITIRNNATQKYLFAFKNNWTYIYQIHKGNWKKPKGNYVSELVSIRTNKGAINFVKEAAKWL